MVEGHYFPENSRIYWQYVREHLSLSFQSLLIASLIGISLGYFCYRYRYFGRLFSFAAQALRIIPSLAVLFFLIPLIGVGRLPAVIALVLLGIPPILMNTMLGFNEVSEVILETGNALGMNGWQLFRKLQLPLALPFLLNGIKLSLVEIIASATLATYIGAGGLGTLIFTGLGLYRIDLLLIGGLSVAFLSFSSAVLFDLLIKRSGY